MKQARSTHSCRAARTTCVQSTISPNKTYRRARTFPSRISWSCMALSSIDHFTQKFGSETANQAESIAKPDEMLAK